MVYVDKYTLRLSGPQMKDGANRHSVKSAYDIRRKAAGGRADAGRWRREFCSSGLSKEQIESKIEEAAAEVEANKKKREGPRNRLTYLRRQSSVANNSIKYSPPNSKAALLSQQKENQHSLRLEEQHFHVLDSAWEE
ncbi:hypothetical protein BGZ65_012091, partial [Modicella reniformis]